MGASRFTRASFLTAWIHTSSRPPNRWDRRRPWRAPSWNLPFNTCCSLILPYTLAVALMWAGGVGVFSPRRGWGLRADICGQVATPQGEPLLGQRVLL